MIIRDEQKRILKHKVSEAHVALADLWSYIELIAAQPEDQKQATIFEEIEKITACKVENSLL